MIERSAIAAFYKAFGSGNQGQIESAQRVLGIVIEEKNKGMYDPTLDEVQTLVPGLPPTTIVDFSPHAHTPPTTTAQKETPPEKLVFHDGDLTYHRDQRELVIDGNTLSLTRAQHELLYLLISNADTPFRREEMFYAICPRVEGFTFKPQQTRALDMHIARLRKKIDPPNTPGKASRIQTLRGLGYAWRGRSLLQEHPSEA